MVRKQTTENFSVLLLHSDILIFALFPHDSGTPPNMNRRGLDGRVCEGHSAKLEQCGSRGLGH